MNWLFPLYLLGAAAILAPILMHLRRKPPQEKMEFSSLLFLDPQTPQPTQKRRLDHWLLLLLRCLALLLLAGMFARPWWSQSSTAAKAEGEAHLILVDRSASMRRGDLWQQATQRMATALQRVQPEDLVAVATFDRETQSVWSFAEDVSQGAVRLKTIPERLQTSGVGWGETQLGQALMQATQTLQGAELGTRQKRLLLISDVQEGSHLDVLRSHVWPESIELRIERVEAPNQNNFSIALAAPTREGADRVSSSAPASTAIRVRLANQPGSSQTDYSLQWEGAAAGAATGQLPAGSARMLMAPPREGTEATAGVLSVSGDAWDFDNRLYLAPAQPRKVRVGWVSPEVDSQDVASPLYYLSRALQPTATLAPALIPLADSSSAIANAGLDVAFFFKPSESRLSQSSEWLKQGGFGIWLLDSNVKARQLEEFTGVQGFELQEAKEEDYRMLGQMNAEHALLRPFGDSRLKDFTKLRFWKHRRLSMNPEAAPQVEILARFDNGDAALVNCRVGKGQLLLLTSGWQPADSQLALSTKFVPMLFGWLEAAGFLHEAEPSLQVGDALPVDSKETATIRTPDGKSFSMKVGERYRAEQPGIYEVTKTNAAQAEVQRYAVNLSPDEGRTAPLNVEQLRDYGIVLAQESTPSQGADPTSTPSGEEEARRLAATEAEQGQQVWWWLLLGILMLLGVETWLAGSAFSLRREKPSGEPLTSST